MSRLRFAFPNFARLAGSAVLALGLLGAASAQTPEPVTVQLDWVVRGNHAPFFIAKDKGYFAQNGIDVTAIRRGTGSVDALRLVGSGGAQFGFGDLPTLAVARSQNVPVVAIAALNQRSPLAMIALAKNKTLKAPGDLKGLKVGIHTVGSTYIFLRAFLAANGMSENDIGKSTVSPPYENFLLLGHVDAVPGYIDAEVPELEAKAGGPGSLSILLGADFGYDVYGSGVFAAEDTIKSKPNLVQGFMTAYLKGFADMVADPSAAADITVKMNPEYTGRRDVLVKQIQADIDKTLFSAETKEHGIGAMTSATWASTVKTMVDQGALKQAIDPAAAFTNRFVEGGNPLKK